LFAVIEVVAYAFDDLIIFVALAGYENNVSGLCLSDCAEDSLATIYDCRNCRTAVVTDTD
jgi:hypothetical protein